MHILNDPFKPTPKVYFQDVLGNAGNGSRPNPPTIPNQEPGTFPRVNPYAQFQIGSYNNAVNEFEKYNPTLHSNTQSERNYYSNNPVGIEMWDDPGGAYGNAGNGDNQGGVGYTPMPWSPYNLSDLGVQGGTSQSYPYNPNQIYFDGGARREWNFTYNVNQGDPIDIGPGTTEPGSEDPNLYLQQLIAEMGGIAVPPIKEEKPIVQ